MKLGSLFSLAHGSGEHAGGSGDCSSYESDCEVYSESDVANLPTLDSSENNPLI